ncbi:MAG TPA: hypothetical protein PLE72_12395 [Azospira sp.]|nr:hypothetical protein [Azospira sp.]
MRGLAKPAPPKNVAADGQQARAMTQARKDLLHDLPQQANQSAHARACFNALDKPKLRKVLREEQGALCVYCERRVTTEERVDAGRPAPRIEHWRPLSLSPQLALDWDNLYLSCTTEHSCDRRKEDTARD